jgi:hypothetical protein
VGQPSWGRNRPPADNGDAAVCLDGADSNSGNLCLRAKQIDLYINSIPNGTNNWLEQLTASQKTLKVPLSINNTDVLTSFKFYSSSITPSSVTAQTCSDQTFTISGLVTTDKISNVFPPAALGNVSLNAYVSSANTVLFHFCNPSPSSVTPPAGSYSFLAVH